MATKKKNPAVGVLRYFEEGELAAVQLALSLAADIVRRRTPAKPAAVKKPAAKAKPLAPVPAVVGE